MVEAAEVEVEEEAVSVMAEETAEVGMEPSGLAFKTSCVHVCWLRERKIWPNIRCFSHRNATDTEKYTFINYQRILLLLNIGLKNFYYKNILFQLKP